MTGSSRRVRVTAPETDEHASRRGVPVATRGIALPGDPVDEADAVYARALQRSQLLLAWGTVAGFVTIAAAIAVAIAIIPETDEITVLGVPLSWVLHAFGFYPVILGFALLYVRTAARNERRYRALKDPE